MRQALAGAGLATLYAGFYLAGTQYGLIGAGAAFLGLAAVTAAAIALSFRFGLPSAVLGLVGGFAAPALVASEEANVPLLTLYLALITAGLAFTGQRQGRPWLGYAALAAGSCGASRCSPRARSRPRDLLALGLFLTAMGAVLPMLTGAGRGWHWARLGAAGLASLQLAALIELAGFQPLTWGLYLLLAAALAALGWREPRLREASAFAAALGLWLLTLWDAPPARDFALVGAGFAAIFVLAPLAFLLLGRGRRLDLWQLSLAAPALAAVTYGQFGDWDTAGAEPLLAAVTAALALPPALAAWREWRLTRRRCRPAARQRRRAGLRRAADAGAGLGRAAGAEPRSRSCSACSPGAGRRRALLNLAWTGALSRSPRWRRLPHAAAEGVLLAGSPTAALRSADRRPLVARCAGSPPACRSSRSPGSSRAASARPAAEALAALLAYGVAGASRAGGLARVGRRAWRDRAVPGAARRRAAAGARCSAWRCCGRWRRSSSGPPTERSRSAAMPLLLDGVPAGARCCCGSRRSRSPPVSPRGATGTSRRVARVALVAAGIAGFVAVHSLYKLVFAIGTRARVRPRSAWPSAPCGRRLLAGIGLALVWRGPAAGSGRRRSPCSASRSRTSPGSRSLLHDPLWSAQAVGPWPLANWLLPAYAVAAARWSRSSARSPSAIAALGWAADAALMALIALFALTELRQPSRARCSPRRR